MSSGVRVLHVSKTPLVGAPGKIVQALNTFSDMSAALIVGGKYPRPLEDYFLENAILFERMGPVFQRCLELIREADVIHVHNDVPDELRSALQSEARAGCRFVYQVHSALREGPLFFDRSELLGLPFHAHLTIPHYPQRFFPNYRLVPNIVVSAPSLRPIGGERPRILFSPAHERTGMRWGDKVSGEIDRALSAIQTLRMAEVIDVRGISPTALMEIRRGTHITIDEIVTGAFHQISLEGLATGNVVVNNADDLALLSFQAACEVGEPPPFLRVDGVTVASALTNLLGDRAELARLQQQSHAYFMTYLRPERLVTRFMRIYEELLR